MEKINFDKSLFIGKNVSEIQNDYKVLSILGQGAFSVVYKALHRKTECLRCIKKIKISNFTKADEESIMNEIKMLKVIDHPYIMKIYEYYEKDDYIYIVTEYLAGGELFERIDKLTKFTEATAAGYISQILMALSYLHSKNIIHRDIKPENIVFETNNANSNLKVIDFGTSREVVEHKKLNTKMGTAYYIAPEVLLKNYDFKCDIWSCGVILYVFLCGYPPFNGSSEEKIIRRVIDGTLVFPKEEWSHISDEAKNLITRMLTYNPEHRPTADQVLQDPWFNKVSKTNVDLNSISSVICRLKSFEAKKKLQKAICLYFVNFFDIAHEKEELLRVFESMDLNFDGKLSRDELVVAYSKIYDYYTAEFYVDSIMKTVDFNNTDAIDFSEFLAANIDYQKAFNNDKLKMIFSVMDVDGSGTITLEELRSFFNFEEDHDNKLAKNIMMEVDRNGDGVISFDEFLQMMDGFYRKI